MNRVLAQVQLSRFDNSWYNPGGTALRRAVWFFIGLPLLRSPLLPFSRVRAALLRSFGARVGRGVVIKPGVRVKYPWRLKIGDYSWIGEDCWIDNLADVAIGNNVCLSQASYLCTGNHNWSDEAFGLRAQPMYLEDGVWIGARACVGPGIRVCEGAVIALGGVAHQDVPPFEIHAGNPARLIRYRTFHSHDAQIGVTGLSTQG